MFQIMKALATISVRCKNGPFIETQAKTIQLKNIVKHFEICKIKNTN